MTRATRGAVGSGASPCDDPCAFLQGPPFSSELVSRVHAAWLAHLLCVCGFLSKGKELSEQPA